VVEGPACASTPGHLALRVCGAHTSVADPHEAGRAAARRDRRIFATSDVEAGCQGLLGGSAVPAPGCPMDSVRVIRSILGQLEQAAGSLRALLASLRSAPVNGSCSAGAAQATYQTFLEDPWALPPLRVMAKTSRQGSHVHRRFAVSTRVPRTETHREALELLKGRSPRFRAARPGGNRRSRWPRT